MNIVNVLTLRHLKLNKRRTLITIIGVALSVCMITAVATFTASFLDLLQRTTIDDTGFWHIGYDRLTYEEASRVAEAMKENKVSYVSTEGSVGYALLPGSRNENKPYLFIQAVDQTGFDTFNYKLIEGRFPQNSGEVVISSHIEENGGVVYKIGDVLTLDIGKRYFDNFYHMDQTTSYIEPGKDSAGETLKHLFTKEFTVTGIMERPKTEPYWAPGYTVVTFLDQDLSLEESSLNVYGAYKNVPRSIYKKGGLIAEKAGIDPSRTLYNTSLLRYHLIVSEDWILGTLYGLIGFVIFLIMVGSVSLIYNAFAISISERSRHLGMLASVGATKKQKKNSVYFEGFFVGIMAIPIGLFFGTIGIGVTLKLVSPLINGMISDIQQFRLVVSPYAILVSILLSAVTIYGSVWVPAKRASRISPIDAIRQTKDVKLTGKKLRTLGITKVLFGFEAELALKNLKRNNKRYKATVISLVLSIVLFLSVSSFSLMSGRSADMATNNYAYDVSVDVYSGDSDEAVLSFFQGIKGLDGITMSMIQRSMYAKIKATEELLTPDIKNVFDTGYYPYVEFYEDEQGESHTEIYFSVNIYSMEEEAFQNYTRKIGVDPEGLKDVQNPKAILINTTDVKLENQYVRTDYLNVKKGDTLELIHNGTDLVSDISIYAITEETPFGKDIQRYPNPVTLYVSEEVFESFLSRYKGEIYSYRELQIKTDQSEKLVKDIYEYQKQTSIGNIGVYDVNSGYQEQRRFLTFVYVFFYGFVALITAICVANILNTVSTGISLRKREFGMMRSVGMTPKGFYKMIYYESIFYGLKALLYGLPLSYLMMRILYKIMRDAFMFGFVIPWGSVIAAVVAVFIIVSATMLYSGAKLRKENIMDMIRTENN